MSPKIVWTTDKHIVLLQKIQDNIFLKNIEITTYWIDPGQSRLTF